MFFVCFQTINAQNEYPVLTEIVTDNAHIFSEEEIVQLSQKLKAYETNTTHQIVVLTIESLGPDTIENYAYQTFNLYGNKFGQEAADNGILVLFSALDRKVRIEVGDGFTPIITDAFASRIIRQIMIPAFKEQQYFQGIHDGTTEIIKLVDSPEYRDEFTDIIESENNIPIWGITLLGLFVTAFLGFFLFIGGRTFIGGYKQLINLYKGLITGKVSVLMFPLLLVITLISILFSLPFVLMPILFGIVIFSKFNNEAAFTDPNTIFEKLGWIEVNSLILVVVFLFVCIPIVIAYYTRSKKKYTPIKFSLTKSDKRFMSKNFSSGGVHSGGSSFSSSSSSSSFSGGGGSSSGGGASGSW